MLLLLWVFDNASFKSHATSAKIAVWVLFRRVQNVIGQPQIQA